MSLIDPVELWDGVAARLARDPAGSAGRLVLLVLLGAAGMAAAVAIGTQYITVLWNADFGFLPSDDGRFDPLRWTLVGGLAAPLFIAAMFLVMTPLYRQPRRPLAAFAVAAVGLAPVYVAGLSLVFMPAILLVGIALIVSAFWWAAGAQRLLGIPSGELAEFTVLALLGASVLLQFLGAALAGWL